MKLLSLTFLILTLLIAVFLLSFTLKKTNNKNIYDFKLKTIEITGILLKTTSNYR